MTESELRSLLIQNDAEHAACLFWCEMMILKDPPADSSNGITLRVLARIVEAYEKGRWPLEDGKEAPGE